MKSLRLRLTLWFALSFLAVTAVLMVFSHHQLEVELRQKHWQKDYPDHPDWKLHGSFSEEEVDDITGELLEGSLALAGPLVVAALIIGYYLSSKSLRPIQNLNQQLQTINSKTLNQPLVLPEADKEFRDLLRHINELLGRLHGSFTEMSEYAAKVAHELRTPLSIMRLKLEQAENKIEPELAEELQDELHRLTHVVDQSLLIAKAEQGRIVLQPEVFDLSELLGEMVKDYHLLATEQGRAIRLQTAAGCRIKADENYFKQILHNLLTNSLKHGQGNIEMRLSRRQSECSMLIYNPVSHQPASSDNTLGLGLRVVGALLSIHPELRYRIRSGSKYHAVGICFPCAAEDRLAVKT